MKSALMRLSISGRPRASTYPPKNSCPLERQNFEYDDDYRTRLVHATGRIRWPGRHVILLGAALAGERIGCLESTEGVWKIFLGPIQLGLIDTARIELGLIRTD